MAGKRAKKRYTMIAMALLFGLVGVAMYIMGFGNRPTHLEPDEAMNMMASMPNAILLDVREQEEFDKKHLPGAILLPLDKLKTTDLSTVLPDKDQPIFVYCWAGRRAEYAANDLAKFGYTKVYEIGGMLDWHGPTEGTEVK
ncbi:MAG: rhodanese-like domain-containing protein [Selenomonadaceae bacterium]|nr:rhodanese-like domain-containing protein [Selenomonadaceae bacterium]